MKKLIIETDKLKENITTIQGMTTSTVIAVLKGNAYGLGMIETAEIMQTCGIDFFAVSEIAEALALRSGGISGRILLLSSTSDSSEIDLLLENNIILTIGSFTSLTAVEAAAVNRGQPASVHIKLDTGFGRYGFLPSDMDRLILALADCSNIMIEGAYTHLSSAFAKKPAITLKQYTVFKNCIDKLKNNGVNTGLLHIANSSAFLQYNNLHLDAVRVGSAFLGRISLPDRWGLHRIGYIRSALSEIKTLPAKHPIGYANTFSTRSETKIGIVPVGYMDGFGVEKSRDTFRFMDIARYLYHDLRSFKKHLYVKVNGRKVPILGRVNMYNIIVDLGDTEAKIGDEVILDINPLFINSGIEREHTHF